MPYAAIDLETTGLEPARHQVLELACVVETDWLTPVDALPRFRALVNPGEIRGDAVALAMNAGLLAELAANPHAPPLGPHLIDLAGFLAEHFNGSVTIAGKNFGAFDYQFLRRCPEWKLVRHKRRFIDAGSLWWEPDSDECLPDLAACQSRANVLPWKAHSALEDCYAVIECVRAARLVRLRDALRAA